MKFDLPADFPLQGPYAIEFPCQKPEPLGGGWELGTRSVTTRDSVIFECRQLLRRQVPWVRVCGFSLTGDKYMICTFAQPGLDYELEIVKFRLGE